MKVASRTLGLCFMALTLLFSVPSIANSPVYPSKVHSPMVKKAKWAGIWDYTVQDVPPEYNKGVLHVTKKKRVHMVQIELANGTIDAEDVVVKKNQLSFSLPVEGQMVSVSLTMDGDTFSGESSSPDGVFPLQGKRR